MATEKPSEGGVGANCLCSVNDMSRNGRSVKTESDEAMQISGGGKTESE